MPEHPKKITLPNRQKIYLGICLSLSLYIFFYCWTYDRVGNGMNDFIIIYSICVPVFLLSEPAIIDLNNNKTFILWLGVSVLFLAIGVSTNHNSKFLIQHSPDFDGSSGDSIAYGRLLYFILKSVILFSDSLPGIERFAKKNYRKLYRKYLQSSFMV